MYFRNPKLDIDPMKKNIYIREEHVACRPLLKREGAPAGGLPLTLDHLVQPRKVYSSAPVCSSILPRHDHLVASMVSTWVTVEVATCNVVVCPSELPMGLSMLLLHGPCSLLVAHRRPSVRPPRTCSPSRSHAALSSRSSV
jgi:hypothetical protein